VAIEKKDAAPLSEGVAGPVGIYSVVGTIIQIPDLKERLLQLLNLAGLLSISLAIFNVLPIPALDGGRLFFILVEAVTRRKVNARFETVVHTIGMAVLLLLIVAVTFKDVFQFIL
jgi:regulator of sigma E protease